MIGGQSRDMDDLAVMSRLVAALGMIIGAVTVAG